MAPLVSIHCITYNHEKYIGKAIEGFLMQKTEFEYEIIIGEDCSPDKTLEVVRAYERQHPDKIRVIHTGVNVGMNKNSRRVFDAATGEFVAVCEGDDYWIDPYKLQKQVDFMRKHPDCSMVFHGAEIVNVQTGAKEGELRPYDSTGLLDDSKLFYGGGDTVPTASIMLRRDLFTDKPEFYLKSPVGDHAIALLTSARGRIGYINEMMSVRTLWVPESWNTRFNGQKDVEKSIRHINAMGEVLRLYNEYTKGKYDVEIKKRILNGKIEIARLKKESPFRSHEVIQLLESFSVAERLKIKVIYRFPQLYGALSKLKKV